MPFPAGGPGEALARLIGRELEADCGQPLVTEFRPKDGLEYAAKAAPDGHTFVMVTGSFFINASLCRTLPYDPVADFAAVSLLTSVYNLLVVHADVPARDLKQLIAHAKLKPGELKYASSGYGTSPHLSGELLKIMAGIAIAHAEYQGHLAASHAVCAGRDAQLMFDAISSAMPHLKSGELRALAVTTAHRAPMLAQVPTMSESGLPGFDVSPVIGLLAPAQTAPEHIDAMSKKLTKIMHLQNIAEQVRGLGMEAVGSTRGEFADYMRDAFAASARLVRQAGL
jgi:tripartite-type tricarboxylate transporter receptor subunit TctC